MHDLLEKEIVKLMKVACQRIGRLGGDEQVREWKYGGARIILAPPLHEEIYKGEL
jgi:hypothetical protein